MNTTSVVASGAVVMALVVGASGHWSGTAERSPSDQSMVATSTALLSTAQREALENFGTPLDSEGVVYSVNLDLSATEVLSRNIDIGESYEIGEPLSLEDLEFLRVYAMSRASDSRIVNSNTDGRAEVIAQGTVTQKFSKASTQAGTTASISGSATSTIGAGVSNSWSASWTAKRTSGTNLTKITSKVDVYGYGTVAAWPYIGLVYEAHPSANSTSQSFYFNRTANFTAFIAYMTVNCTSTFNSAKGSFQITAF